MNDIDKYGLSYLKDYVIYDEFGIVLATRFSFKENGYINNFSNFDFYKWEIKNNSLYLFDTFKTETVIFNSKGAEWSGIYSKNGQQITLKEYISKNNVLNKRLSLTKRLKNTRWRFRNDKGDIISNDLWLCEDGRIRGYKHSNEFFWKVENNELGFYDINNVKTTNFGKLFKNELKFIGKYLISDNFHHTLEYLSSNSEYINSEFVSNYCTNSDISFKSKNLLVIFNSIGKLYNGKNILWEFYNLPYQLSLDCIRFSESLPMWYIDKKVKILQILSKIIENYEQVILLGGSAGGYASLMFGEILALNYPKIKFFTFSLNPQTTLELEDIKYMLENYNEPQRPALPSDFVLKKSQFESLDLNFYLRSNKTTNLKHYIFYDSLNECERFFIDRLDSKRVVKNGLPIKGGHADSLKVIADTGSIYKDIFDLTNY